jgi:hypothetical protein
MKPGNIFSEIPDSVKDEIFEALLKTDLDFETNWGLDNSPLKSGPSLLHLFPIGRVIYHPNRKFNSSPSLHPSGA